MTRGLATTLSLFATLGALVLAGEARAQCPRGQEINADTAGKCCWPGQAWSKSRSACIGIPSCPPGYKAKGEGCEREACPEMQYINEDTKDHCCWAGQVWSDSKSRCVGVPQMCPTGRAIVGEDCAPAQCDPGQVRVKEGACCWPGQAWWASGNQCMGRPSQCPQGLTSTPEGCFALGWTAFDGAGDHSAAGPPAPTPSAEGGPETWTPPPLLDAFRAPPQIVSPAAAPTPIESGASGTQGSVPYTDALAPPEEPKGPKKGRTSLMLGLLLNDGFAGAFQIRASPRLFSINAETQFKGTGVLLIEPWLWLGGEADRGVGWFRAGLALNLGVGWEQTFGPIEATLRVGVTNGFTFRTIVDPGASGLAFKYELKFMPGITIAVPAGEGTKFVVGFDAYIGGTPLFLIAIGVTF
jgi:hypothetical protein